MLAKFRRMPLKWKVNSDTSPSFTTTIASDFLLFLQLLYGGQAIITVLIMSHRYYAIQEAKNGPPKRDIDILQIDRDKLRRQSSQGHTLPQTYRDREKAVMAENLVLRSKIDGRELPVRIEGKKEPDTPELKLPSDIKDE